MQELPTIPKGEPPIGINEEYVLYGVYFLFTDIPVKSQFAFYLTFSEINR